MKHLFIIITFIVILNSCDDDYKLNKEEFIFNLSDFPNNEQLMFKDLSILTGNPFSIKNFDSLLIIDEGGKSDAISIYSKKTGALLNTELSIGKGPNEVIGTFGHGIINDSIFWSYEGETYTIRFYLLRDILKKSKAKILKKNKFNLKRYAYRITPLNMDTFLMSGCPSYSPKLTILNNTGSVIDSIGMFYNNTFENYTFLKGAYMYQLTVKPDNKRIAFAYYRTDVIEIYNLNGKLIKAIHGPDNFKMEPSPSKNNQSDYFARSKKTKETFIAIRSSNKYIYALYDGMTANKPNPLANWLLVFDWNGNLVKSFKITNKIYAFDVDEANKKIYAASVLTGKLIYANFEI